MKRNHPTQTGQNHLALLFALAVVLCMAPAGTCQAVDTVRLTKGQVFGRITKMTPYAVTVLRSGVDKEIQVKDILCIYYDGEPGLLKKAKTHLIKGRYEDALDTLGKVQTGNLKSWMKGDVDFYKALCATRLALGGSGDLRAADIAMRAFTNKNKKSYHYLEASEAVGDLLVAIGRYSDAVDYYKEVGNAPWDDYKMRAGVAVGRALLAQDKTAEAKATFEKVIDNPAQDKAAQAQRLAAMLGKARCLAAEGQDEQAVKIVRKIIHEEDPKQVRLHARAYNALGTAHRKAGRDKEALLAFLHTDLLYFSDPEAHAEALHNLAQLWEKMHKTERATQARTALQKLYRNSRWAKLGG